MCKEQETKQESTQTTELPKWLDSASETLAEEAKALTEKPFVPYTGDRVADFTGDQQSGFQMVRDMISGAPNLLPETLDMARTYGNTPAQTIADPGRVVDEGGRLGAIKDYLNPYVEGMVGSIDEATAKARKALNARMTMANAFGDAQHGVEGAGIEGERQEAMARMMKGVYDTAMGLRTTDLNRFFQQDQLQAGLNETALQRLLQASNAMINMQGADQNQDLQRISAILASGGTQQGNAQAGLDAQYQEFLREMGWDKDNMLTATSVLSGVPHGSTTEGTATSTQPDNSLWQLAGTLAAAVAAPFTGGASLAIPGLMAGAGGVGPTQIDTSLPWLA